MNINIKSLAMNNFKGFKEKMINFSDITYIRGENACGKTTIIDAFMWLLFDKDSQWNSKFDIRPLGSDGKAIDNIEISVVGTFLIDGVEAVFSKTQKQKWVKKRGTDIAELQGNENLFEINGYPKSEKEYKGYIGNLIDEELFKIVTSPMFFPSQPWKKQREELMRLVEYVVDMDIAHSKEKFYSLVQELEQASADDIRKKYNKALAEWKKKQIELPARIDEASKAIVDIDLSDVKARETELKDQIRNQEERSNNLESVIKTFDDKTKEILILKNKMNTIFQNENDSLIKKRNEIQKRIDTASTSLVEARSRIKGNEVSIEIVKKEIAVKEAKKLELASQYNKIRQLKFEEFVELQPFDEHALVCYACGQSLPEDAKNKKMADYEENRIKHREKYDSEKLIFEEEKKKNLQTIIDAGDKTKKEMNEYTAEVKELESFVQQFKNDVIHSNAEKTKAMEELANMEEVCNIDENKEYQDLSDQVKELETELSNMENGSAFRKQLTDQINVLRDQLSEVEKTIASADNATAKKRIFELQEEQKKVGQKVADQEKQLFLLEEFIRFKMELISSSINEKFKRVSWKLFEYQLNGALKETCECMVNGIPFGSLNNGHKIIAGLDIVSTLSKLHDVAAPVFIDNAEALNDFNIPKMNCQMILLKVSDDATLIIEE